MIITTNTLINLSHLVKNQQHLKQRYIGTSVPLGYDTVHFGTSINRTLTEDEANKRLTYLKRPNYDIDPVVVRKACTDKNNNIKENLVKTAQTLQYNNFSDKTVSKFINTFKKDNGTIDNSIMKYAGKASTLMRQNKHDKKQIISRDGLDTVLAINTKNKNSKVITPLEFTCAMDDMKKYNLTPSLLNIVYSSCRNIQVNDSVPSMFASLIEPKYVDKPEYEKPIKEFSKKFFTYRDKNDVTPVEYKSVLSNFINSDTSLNKQAMDLSLDLADRKSVDTVDISKIVESSIDKETHNVNSGLYSFVKDISGEYSNTTHDFSYTLAEFTMNLANAGSRIFDLSDIDNVQRKNLLLAKKMYKELPKTEEEKKKPEMFLNKIATFINAATNPITGRIDTDALSHVKKLDSLKYTPKSVFTILTFSRTQDGSVDNKLLNKIISNHEKEDKKNIKSVEVNHIENILEETTKYQSGKTVVRDYSEDQPDKLIAYYENHKKKFIFPNKKESIYTKINDERRGIKTKSIQKDASTISDITLFRNPLTGDKKIEYVSQSNVPGILDIIERDKDGQEKILSTGYIDKTGNTIVKRDFKSLDGTRSQIDYKEAPDGSNVSDYVITDNRGTVLLNEHKTFNVIDENHFSSSINEHYYNMDIDKNHILNVKDSDDKTVSFDLDNFTDSDYPFFKDIIKHIPGNEFFNMKKAGTKALITTDIDNGFYSQLGNYISIGKNYNKPSTYFHELGHNKDSLFGKHGLFSQIPISYGDKFKKNCNYEMKLYTEHFPAIQRKYIGYFMTGAPDSPVGQSKQETVAETNSILNTPYQQVNKLEFRTLYLQRYFPRTIATLAKSLNPDIYRNTGDIF